MADKKTLTFSIMDGPFEQARTVDQCDIAVCGRRLDPEDHGPSVRRGP